MLKVTHTIVLGSFDILNWSQDVDVDIFMLISCLGVDASPSMMHVYIFFSMQRTHWFSRLDQTITEPTTPTIRLKTM